MGVVMLACTSRSSTFAGNGDIEISRSSGVPKIGLINSVEGIRSIPLGGKQSGGEVIVEMNRYFSSQPHQYVVWS